MKIDNVQIPYQSGSNYGANFVYVRLSGFMLKVFSEARKARCPTVIDESSLAHDPNRWWKTANNIEGKVGTIDKKASTFKQTSLGTILEGTGKGLTVNIVARFLSEAHTEDCQPLKPSTPQRIVLEIDRAFIVAVDVDVQGPERISKKEKPQPLATRSDVPTDGLLQRLRNLPIWVLCMARSMNL